MKDIAPRRLLKTDFMRAFEKVSGHFRLSPQEKHLAFKYAETQSAMQTYISIAKSL